MNNFTLHHLRCFDAVIRAGSFQAAATEINRSHPSIHAAIGALESQAGFALFDRSGYRVQLTKDGQAFYKKTLSLLDEANELAQLAQGVSAGNESLLSLVIGDISPVDKTLDLLKPFFTKNQNTRLDLHFETLGGPLEQLRKEKANLIIHNADPSDTELETIPLFSVQIIPVVAPDFLDFPIDEDVTPEKMRAYPQCIIRDTAINQPEQNHFIIKGARQWTVADQFTKKQIIAQGMGWGHLPDFLIKKSLKTGKLLALTGKHFRGKTVTISAVRLRTQSHGPIAGKLWKHFEQHALKD